MRSGYAAIYNEEVKNKNIVEEKEEVTLKPEKVQKIKEENTSKKATTQHEGSIITMLIAYISSIVIDIIWVKNFAQGGYFSMAKGFNGRYVNESSQLLNLTGSLFLSLIIIAAVSAIAGLVLSILFHRFRVSKKHMIVYGIMLAFFFYIDIMYIGFSSSNVF